MVYAVKEIFFTLQGEGAHAGRPSVFCRFSGCNLWNGREQDRLGAECSFCDTDFVGTNGTYGKSYASASDLAGQILELWPRDVRGSRYVVCTGGEPLLQLDRELIDALHALEFEVGVETNGTMIPPDGIDWICVSPKVRATLRLVHGNELKIVIPQSGLNPKDFENLAFERFSVQPMDGPLLDDNIRAAVDFCLQNPLWQLSLQTHKMLGIR